MELHDFRREYQQGGLRRENLAQDPITQFEKWFDELLRFNASDPTAMILATVGSDQQVNQRIVLLKSVDEKGFVFFTNYTSAKAQDIHDNNQVSLHFPWHSLERQVIVKGLASKITKEESGMYFSSRPKESQWAAWASKQSEALESRQQLIDRYLSIQQQYPDQVPAPDFWGGYRVEPLAMEFWQGGGQRLHDRFIYKRVSGKDADDKQFTAWNIERLSP